MPLLWFCTALTLKIFYEPIPNLKKSLFMAFLIVLTALVIARFHPLELVYYLIILSVLLLFNMKRILFGKNKKVIFSVLIIFILAFIIIKYWIRHEAAIFALFSSSKSLTQILVEINKTGYDVLKLDIFNEIFLVNHFNAAFSEIARLSIFSALLFRIYYFFKKTDYKNIINMRIYDILLGLSLLFVLIPCIPFLAGVAAYCTGPVFVYRFFYAAPWFIFLPFIAYEIIMSENILKNIRKILTGNPIYRLLIKNEEVVIHSEKRFIALSIGAIIVVFFLIFVIPKKATFEATDLNRKEVSFKNSIIRTFLFETTIQNTKSLINSLDKKKVFNLEEKI